ncbi:hypothetical protein ACFQZC_05155 [Streptacidiphilus monticola]
MPVGPIALPRSPASAPPSRRASRSSPSSRASWRPWTSTRPRSRST